MPDEYTSLYRLVLDVQERGTAQVQAAQKQMRDAVAAGQRTWQQQSATAIAANNQIVASSTKAATAVRNAAGNVTTAQGRIAKGFQAGGSEAVKATKVHEAAAAKVAGAYQDTAKAVGAAQAKMTGALAGVAGATGQATTAIGGSYAQQAAAAEDAAARVAAAAARQEATMRGLGAAEVREAGQRRARIAAENAAPPATKFYQGRRAEQIYARQYPTVPAVAGATLAGAAVAEGATAEAGAAAAEKAREAFAQPLAERTLTQLGASGRRAGPAASTAPVDQLRKVSGAWNQAAAAISDAEDRVRRATLLTAAETDGAAEREIASLRGLGRTYPEIALEAAKGNALRAKSAEEATAAIAAAAEREIAAQRRIRDEQAKPFPQRFQASPAGQAGAAIAGVGRKVAGYGLAAGAGLLYYGARQARTLTEGAFRLRGAAGVDPRQALALANIANAQGLNPAQVGIGLSTLSKQAQGALEGKKAPVELFQKLGISRREVAADRNNVPALFDLVYGRIGKRPEVERAALGKTLLGRGAGIGVQLEAGGPLARQVRDVQAMTPNVDAKRLQELHEAQVKLKEATTALALTFVSQLTPILTKLVPVLLPLVKVLGEDLLKALKAVSSALAPVVTFFRQNKSALSALKVAAEVTAGALIALAVASKAAKVAQLVGRPIGSIKERGLKGALGSLVGIAPGSVRGASPLTPLFVEPVGRGAAALGGRGGRSAFAEGFGRKAATTAEQDAVKAAERGATQRGLLGRVGGRLFGGGIVGGLERAGVGGAERAGLGGAKAIGLNLLKGAGGGLVLGLAGTVGANVLGSIVGGRTGKAISGIGSSAATGAAIGSLVAPELGGTFIGGGIGAAIGAVKVLNAKQSQGEKMVTQALRGLPRMDAHTTEAVAGTILKRQAEIDKRVKQIEGGAYRAQLARGGAVPGERAVPITAGQLHRARTLEQQGQLGQGQLAGAAEARYVMGGVKFPDLSSVIRVSQKKLAELSPVARRGYADMMKAAVQTLEKEKRLPEGSIDKLNKAVGRKFGDLNYFAAHTGQQSMKALEANMKGEGVLNVAKSLVTRIGHEFSGIPSAAKVTMDHAGAFFESGGKRLLQIIRTTTGPQKDAAVKAYKELREQGAHFYGALREEALANITALAQHGAAKTKEGQEKLTQYYREARKDIESEEHLGIINHAQALAKLKAISEHAGPEAVAPMQAAFAGLPGSISGAMARAQKALEAGLAKMTSEAEGALKHLTGQNVTTNFQSGASHEAGPGGAFGPSVAPGTSRPGPWKGGLGKARGGRVPGAGLEDTVPLLGKSGQVRAVVAPGELLVANRHTEQAASVATKLVYGKSLGEMVDAEQRPHSAPMARLQRGGRVHFPGGEIGAIGHALLAKAEQAVNALRASAGGTAEAGGVAGPIVTASEFGGHNDPTAFNKPTASGKTANDALMGFAELSNPPSSLNFSALGHLPMGAKIKVGYGGKVITIPKVDVGAGGPGLDGKIRAIDLTYAAARALGAPGLENVHWARAATGLRLAAGGWVPGSPWHDGTPAMLSGDEFVMTGHGQAMMDAHAPGLLDYIEAHQAPHFATSGSLEWQIQQPTRAHKPAKVRAYEGPHGEELHETSAQHAARTLAEKKAARPGREARHAESERRKAEREARKAAETRVVTAGEYGGSGFGFGELANSLGGLPLHTKIKIAFGNRVADIAKLASLTGSTSGIHGHARALNVTAQVARALGFPHGQLEDVTLSGLGKIKVGATKEKAAKAAELAGQEYTPGEAFETGFEAGQKGEGLKAVIKAAVAAAKTALKAQSEGPQSGAEGQAAKGASGAVAKMLKAATQIQGKPYVYGGGHGSFSSSGYDCSGAVSYVLHGAGLLGQPMSTDGLKTYGQPGEGKQVSIGVRGSTGQSAHTMMKIGSHYFESGGTGGGPHWDQGWDGSFPIKRHPPGLRRGGRVSGRQRPAGGPVPPRMRLGGRPLLDPAYSWLGGLPQGVWDPTGADFVGFGLRRGGRPSGLRRGGHQPPAVHPHVTASKGKIDVLIELPSLEGPAPPVTLAGGRALAGAQGADVAAGLGAVQQIEGTSSEAQADKPLEALGMLVSESRKWAHEALEQTAKSLDGALKAAKAHHQGRRVVSIEAHLKAVDDALAHTQELSLDQLQRFANTIKARVGRARDPIQARRLTSALAIVEGEIGKRVGEQVKGIELAGSALAAQREGKGTRQLILDATGKPTRDRRTGQLRTTAYGEAIGYRVHQERLGVAQGSERGLSEDIGYDQAVKPQYEAQLKALGALKARAKAAGATKAVGQIEAQMDKLQETITDTTTEMIVKRREFVALQAQEAVARATHGQTMAQGGLQMLEAQQGPNAGTPGAFQAQAATLAGSVLPAQQAVLSALQGQEGVLAKQAGEGDTGAAQTLVQVQEQIQQQQVAMIKTQNEAAEKLLDAAKAQVEAAARQLNIATTGTSILQQQQVQAGTTGTPEALRQQAAQVAGEVVPRAQAVLAGYQNEAAQAAANQNVKGLEEAQEHIAQAQLTVIEKQNEAAQMLMDAAKAQVDAATRQVSIGRAQLRGRELTQELNYTTATAGPGNAKFISEVLKPAQEALIAADLTKQREDEAHRASQQQREEDQLKVLEDGNGLIELSVEEMKAVKDNTTKMVNASGSLGFSFQGQDMTDLINVGTGA